MHQASNYYLQRPLPAPSQPAEARQAALVVASAAKPDTEGWVEVGDLGMLVPGDALRFEHAGKSYAIYRTQIGQLFASDSFCTHGRAQLTDDFLQGTCIECPKHNGRFDIRDGSVRRPPPRVAVKTYEVREKGGRVLLKVPSVQEATPGSATRG